MDAAQALAELMELSTQIEVALVTSTAGEVVAASVSGERADELAGAAADLVTMADRVRADLGREALSQMQAATAEGSVFAVVDRDRVAVAVTGPDPTAGLILYDLKTLLRQIAPVADGEQAAEPAAAEPADAAEAPAEDGDDG